MAILTIQIIVLVLLVAVVALWGRYFPYPSPVVRHWLPARIRWPEQQIRDWLSNGRFQHAYLRYFYRDPERFPPQGTSIIAPADGIVTGTDVRDGTRYLVIALSFWDMHVQRSPASGVVLSVDDTGDTIMDGEGQQFAFLKAKHCPVQKRIVLETASGRLAVRLITSLAARRIEAWVKPGDEVSRGQRIGRILLGSTVVLELPDAVPLLVPTGVRVRAGETPVAKALTAP